MTACQIIVDGRDIATFSADYSMGTSMVRFNGQVTPFIVDDAGGDPERLAALLVKWRAKEGKPLLRPNQTYTIFCLPSY